MKKTKQFISKLLVLCLLLSIWPSTVHAATLTVGSSGATYTTLTAALTAAADGDTITLLTDITESVSYAAVPGKTITIDGQNFTIRGADGKTSVALTVTGSGFLKLKDLKLQGGTASEGGSVGMIVKDSANVQSEGTVDATGGLGTSNSYGLVMAGTGTVNITSATKGTGYGGLCGVVNYSAGTVNVITAVGLDSAVDNDGTGTVNVTNADSFARTVFNGSTGTVNVNTAVSSRGDGIYNNAGGTINVANNTGNINNQAGIVNVGSNNGTVTGTINTNVSRLILNRGSGASCILDSIVIAAADVTKVGALPPAYKGGAESGWYTDSAKQTHFNGIVVTGGTILYSTFCTNYAVSGKITGSDAPGGLAASLQLKDCNGNNMGNPVTAGANGTYAMNVPEGTGYTIAVSLSGYGKGTISSFDVAGVVVGKDLTLTKAYNISGKITGSDTGASGLAASLQLKDSQGRDMGSPVIAGADGTYSIIDMPEGTGYTIAVTMAGYYDDTIPAFDISNVNVTANLTLKKIYTVSGKINGSDTSGGLAARLQLKDSHGNNFGSAVTAEADGTYSLNAPADTGYTIVVTMKRYYDSTISSFDIDADVTGKDLTLQKAVQTVGIGGGYSSLSTALAAAGNGDTITLLNDITESVSYTTETGDIVTIDGQHHTITGTDGSASVALTLRGAGTVVLKNLNLLGGTALAEDSSGVEVYNSVRVLSVGTVNTTGGAAVRFSRGLLNGSDKVVDVTTATGGTSQSVSYGVHNSVFATTNVYAAKGDSYGIRNENIGVVNATTAQGGIAGVYNYSAGTVNVTTSNGAKNAGRGYINVKTNTGDASNTGEGSINTNIATITLNKGSGASCVLDDITVAATGNTNVGILPSVYKDGVVGIWYTDTEKNNKFIGPYVTAATVLYSGFADKMLVSISNPTDITSVTNGTAKTASALGLPDKISLVTGDGNISANVSWKVSESTYDPSRTEEQTFTVEGDVTLPAGVMNPNNVALTASISVTVNAATYAVTVENGTGSGSYAGGETVNITANATPQGKVFDKWTSGDGVTFTNANVSSTSFVMPAKAVTVTATYKVLEPPVVNMASLQDGMVGLSYSAILQATGTTPITWSVTGSLPVGLSLSSDGIISGTPTTVGNNTFSLTATNVAGSDTRSYSIVVKNQPSKPDSDHSSGNGSGGGSGKSSSSGGGTPAAANNPTTSVTGTITTEAKGDSNGKVAASVTESQVTDAVKRAVATVTTKGKDVQASVEIQVTAAAGAKSVEIGIPKASFNTVASSQVNALKVSTPIAALTFDDKALSTISNGATGDVKISASKVDTATLSEEAKQTIGDRPVFNFSVTSGDKTISQFGGNVSVSVPYTPKAGEDTNAIVIYFINAEGKPEIVSNCKYDPATGTITFVTNHFSKYAVGYNKVSFKDVTASAWYSEAVNFVAARGITSGTGNNMFSPEAKLTRGQFLVMMMRAYGITPDDNAKDNFSDAGNTYQTGYLATAKSLGLTAGVGNNLFAPEKEITRQEMMTLLYNTLKQIGELPTGTTGKTLASYSDAGSVASWANDAMTRFVSTGIIKGNGGRLSPADKINRAEMAQVLYQLMIK